MRCRVLGCDGSYPAANGACSGYLISQDEMLFQIDMGSAVLPRLSALCDPAALKGIFLSHWHFDHASDLLPLRYYLLITGQRLNLYAPEKDKALRPLCEGPEFRFHNLAMGAEFGKLKITTFKTNHPVENYAIKFSADDKSLVYTGDTGPCEGLAEFSRDADLLICDATFLNSQYREGLPHMTAAQAAKTAKEAKVKRLILTHCPPVTAKEALLSEAREVFTQTDCASAGLDLLL